jgi:hypothetical protein
MNIKTYFIITKLSDLPFMDIILLCWSSILPQLNAHQNSGPDGYAHVP